jgi:hypothetical protein
MTYPYVRTTWQDRQVQNPMNFTATGTAAATQGGSIVLTPNEGAVTQTGTPLTAATMNNIEQGIVDLNNNKMDLGAFGLGGKSIDIAGQDLNTLSATGWYSGYNLINYPPDSLSAVGYIEHIEYRGAGYCTQRYVSGLSTLQVFFRRKINGVWEPWSKSLTGAKVSEYYQGSADTTLPTATYVKVDWNQGTTPKYWDNTNKQFKIPNNGKYRLHAEITFRNLTASGQSYLHWNINGSIVTGNISNMTAGMQSMSAIWMGTLSTNDLINVEAYISAGTGVVYGVWSHMTIEEVG